MQTIKITIGEQTIEISPGATISINAAPQWTNIETDAPTTMRDILDGIPSGAKLKRLVVKAKTAKEAKVVQKRNYGPFRQLWTSEDNEKLEDMVNRGATCYEIADAMPGRNAYAVKQRIYSHFNKLVKKVNENHASKGMKFPYNRFSKPEAIN